MNTTTLELKTLRDLHLFPWDPPSGLLLAHDHTAGIGPQAQDLLPAAAEDVGYFTARLVFMKVLAAGADPLFLLHNLGVGDPLVRRNVLRGVADFLNQAGLSHLAVGESSPPSLSIPLTWLGLTLVGRYQDDTLTIGGGRAGDLLYLVGHPHRPPLQRWGRQDTTMPTITHLRSLQSHAHDLLPIGSQGVVATIDELARAAGLGYQLTASLPPWLQETETIAGTALLVALAPSQSRAAMALPVPVTRIGTLTEPALA